LCGLAVDLDHAGALLIRDADQRLHRLIAGDVTLTG
jgi:biotin-(acetyl-CoA carboxylase) ligase